MRVLVLFVHPKHDSFCGRALETVCAHLRAGGHQVEVGDLYAEGFNPALIPEDYAQFTDEPMPDDVLREQARVDRNEALIVIAPVWWWQYPAMLKGWIDRVFIGGWAFTDARGPNTAPILGLKGVLVMASAGAEQARFDKYGYREGIQALWGTGVWGYCGIDVQTRILWSVRTWGKPDHEYTPHLDEARDAVEAFMASIAPPAREPALTDFCQTA
jgi:NAD(P)H dehydrogenase (quinone)